MRFRAVLLSLILFQSAKAFELSVRARRPDPRHDLRRDSVSGVAPLDNNGAGYYANITLGGEQFEVHIDTGRCALSVRQVKLLLIEPCSSDLWVSPSANSLNDILPVGAMDTGKNVSFGYVDKSGVTGEGKSKP